MTDEEPLAEETARLRSSSTPTEPDGTQASAGPLGAMPEEVASRDRVTVRRSPRYGRFIILGAGLGAILTFALTNLFPIDETVGFGALFGYFLLFGVPIGAGLGGLFAVLLDVLSSRRSTELEAERTAVDAPDEELEGDLED